MTKKCNDKFLHVPPRHQRCEVGVANEVEWLQTIGAVIKAKNDIK